MLKRGLLWLTVAVYVACFIINKEDKSALPVINVASLAIPGAFVSFLVTFYHSTCYAKYFDSYKLCIQLGGKTVDFGIYVASIFENNLEEASSLTGLASLAQHRFFWMISSNKEDHPEFKITDVVSLGLCTEDEYAKLSRLPYDQQHVMAITWCLRRAIHLCEKHGVTNRHCERLEMSLIEIRDAMGALKAFAQHQIPLSYFHVVSASMTLFCVAYAFAAVQLDSDLSWICVLIYVLAIIGTQEVAQCLADPFGSDVTDLPLASFWHQTKKTLDGLMNSSIPPHAVVNSGVNPLATETDPLITEDRL